ncbi:serine/threonine-protein kinase, partial [Streptomyces capparidis]
MTLSQGDPRTVGRYRLEQRLGSGGMGVVYLATSPSGRRVAVKVIRPEIAAGEEFRARFRREVAAARKVSGAFTAPVVDADPDADPPWLATLHVPGPSLHQRVTERGPLTAAEARALGIGLVEALRDIHRVGLVHRDLKPANVLLADDGPRVIDFGISRAAGADRLTHTGVLVGTPPFMAPEQFLDPARIGPPTDVFALGAVLAFALAGHGPFDTESPYAVAYHVVHEEPRLTGVDAALRPVIEACLSKVPEDRPDLDALLATLEAEGAEGEGEQAAAPGPAVEPAPAPSPPRPAARPPPPAAPPPPAEDAPPPPEPPTGARPPPAAPSPAPTPPPAEPQ